MPIIKKILLFSFIVLISGISKTFDIGINKITNEKNKIFLIKGMGSDIFFEYC